MPPSSAQWALPSTIWSTDFHTLSPFRGPGAPHNERLNSGISDSGIDTQGLRDECIAELKLDIARARGMALEDVDQIELEGFEHSEGIENHFGPVPDGMEYPDLEEDDEVPKAQDDVNLKLTCEMYMKGSQSCTPPLRKRRYTDPCVEARFHDNSPEDIIFLELQRRNLPRQTTVLADRILSSLVQRIEEQLTLYEEWQEQRFLLSAEPLIHQLSNHKLAHASPRTIIYAHSAFAAYFAFNASQSEGADDVSHCIEHLKHLFFALKSSRLETESYQTVLDILKKYILEKPMMWFAQFFSDEHAGLEIWRQALAVVPPDDPDFIRYHEKFGWFLLNRGVMDDREEDFDECFNVYTHLLELSPLHDLPTRISCLHRLAALCSLRYTRKNRDYADLLQAIHHGQTALKLAESSSLPISASLHSMVFGQLAICYSMKFELSGDVADLDTAISLSRNSVSKVSPTDIQYLTSLQRLSSLMLNRCVSVDGNESKLEEAVALARQVANIGNKSLPAMRVLGKALITLYRRFQRTSDLDEAIQSLRMATLYADRSGAVIAAVIKEELAVCLMYKAQSLVSSDGHVLDKGSFQEYIGEAIELLRSASVYDCIMPTHEADRMQLVAVNLTLRYSAFGDEADIIEAIRLHEHYTTSAFSPDFFAYMRHANTLETKYSKSQQVEDLTRAEELYTLSLKLLPPQHPNYSTAASSLARIQAQKIQTQVDMAISETQERKLQQMRGLFREAVDSPTSSTLDRFSAATRWIAAEEKLDQSDSVKTLDAYEAALELLPRIAWVGLDNQSRHAHLSTYAAGLASRAAAYAIELGRLERAVELLEAGRSLIWEQSKQPRMVGVNSDTLSKMHPDLARELRAAGMALESTDAPDAAGMIVPDELGRRRDMARNWDEIVDRVRQLAGFGEFLRVPSYPSLAHASESAPVVIVNCSPRRCDALLIESPTAPVRVINLTTLSLGKVNTWAKEMRELVFGPARRTFRASRGLVSRDSNVSRLDLGSTDMTEDEIFCDILRDLWTHIAQPILCALPETCTRLHWSMTGPLWFLPIHAAGIYDGSAYPQSNVVDRLISSYAPSLRMIIRDEFGGTDRPSLSPGINIGAIVQPNTPGFYPLMGTVKELNVLKGLVSRHQTDYDLNLSSLVGEAGTIEESVHLMKGCNWIHLACHGIQTPSDPFRSGFRLHDGLLEASRLIELGLLETLDFAFLSACETSTGDNDAPDEALSLAGTFLFAGAKRVIASLWSIIDEDGPVVSEGVYARLFDMVSEGHLDAAGALNSTIRDLRASGLSPLRWAPFVHVGVI